MKFLTRFFKRIKFQWTTATYMRVAYLTPRKVVLVTTRHDGKDNILPIDWHIPISFSPKLYAICLESGNYSAAVIRQTGIFVVNFVSATLEEQILLSGRSSGRDTDKFELTGLEKKAGVEVPAPVLKAAVGWLECRLSDTIVLGDHTLFVGQVVFEQIDEQGVPELYHMTKQVVTGA